ncbi:MAG: hypothetical protein WC863_01930 [Patescibacteria group bacterium]
MGNIVSSRKLSVHKEHEVLQKLEDGGLNDRIAQYIIESKENKIAKKLISRAEELIIEETVFKIIPFVSFSSLEEGKEFTIIHPKIKSGEFLAQLPLMDAHGMDVILLKCSYRHLANSMYQKFRFISAAHLVVLGKNYPEVVKVCRHIMSLDPSCHLGGTPNKQYGMKHREFLTLNYFDVYQHLVNPGSTLSFEREKFGDDANVWFAVTPIS